MGIKNGIAGVGDCVIDGGWSGAGREMMCAGMNDTAREKQGTPEGLLSVQQLAPIEWIKC